jgi:hypothetical protein
MLQFPEIRRDLDFLHNIQNHSWGEGGGLPLMVKLPRCEGDHSPPSSTEGESVVHTLNLALQHTCNFIMKLHVHSLNNLYTIPMCVNYPTPYFWAT